MARTAEEGLLPLELIFKHLLNHRDQIISRRAELAAQGRVANVEIECRLGTLMRGGERVGACEAGEEAAIVYGAKFCAGVAAEHHREFKEAARLEYHKQLKLGARLKAERRTLSDVWMRDDASGRRASRRFIRDAIPLTAEELARGLKNISDRPVKQEIKYKDICPDLDMHLPSHKYDLRVSVSIEESIPAAAHIHFSSEPFHRQRDRYSVVCVLPREHSHLPLPTLDASRVVSRTGTAALHTTFEFELEAGRDVTELFLRPDGNPLKLAQSLWYGMCCFLPAAEQQPPKRQKLNSPPHPSPHSTLPHRPLRIATYFGAFDPVHENHVRQAEAACLQFRIDACFFCPNSDQGNDTKSIGVSQALRTLMLEERCRGHGIFRVHNCGGRGWNWEGRRAATCTCLAAAPRSHADARATVSLECARLLQPSPDHPVELFQIIGQDSYEGAVRKSNGMVLNKLLHPPRSLIVTPREACVAQAESSGTDIVVPPQHSSRIFVLDGYRDEIVLSSTDIRKILAEGKTPSERALHPAVMSLIARHGLYGVPSSAAPASAQPAAAPAPAPVHVAAVRSPVREAPNRQAPSHSTPQKMAAEISAGLPPPPRKCHVVVLFGAHGVGKGAVAEALCRKHGYAQVSFGDIKRGIVTHNPSLSRNFEALGPAVFRSYQQRVSQLLEGGARRLVVDGLDPQYWKGQGHATLGAVDVCLLLKCSNRSSDIDELVRRVIARGRESASVAENRVRKHFSDSVRSWDIVANLPQWLRGAVVEVNGMQAQDVVLQHVEAALQPYMTETLPAHARSSPLSPH